MHDAYGWGGGLPVAGARSSKFAALCHQPARLPPTSARCACCGAVQGHHRAMHSLPPSCLPCLAYCLPAVQGRGVLRRSGVSTKWITFCSSGPHLEA